MASLCVHGMPVETTNRDKVDDVGHVMQSPTCAHAIRPLAREHSRRCQLLWLFSPPRSSAERQHL
eukprot:372983-Amphidinium_carterae.1